MNLELVKFLQEHPQDYEGILTNPPYNLFVRHKDNFVLFVYNQIESNFDIPLVQECRGIILEEGTWKVTCFPFTKFWNAGEGRAAQIDWSTARVQEKLDGSMIKLWCWEGTWWVSSMGVIDAHECELQNDLNDEYKNFYDLFMEGMKKTGVDHTQFDPNYTYMFELTSPYNRVVVPHTEIKIYHTGTRDNRTLEELDMDIGIDKPREYPMSSLEQVMEASKKLPFIEEGYVVVDANWNRVKIKSPAYVSVHHLHNNGNINKKRALSLVMLNEQEEFLSYYPEYREFFDDIRIKFEEYLEKVKADVAKVQEMDFPTRKDYALYVKKLTNPHVHFEVIKGTLKPEDVEKFIRGIRVETMCDILKIKE